MRCMGHVQSMVLLLQDFGQIYINCKNLIKLSKLCVAYKAYLASLGTNKATASKALFLTTPGGAPFAPGATKSALPATPSAKAFTNVTEAYSYYEQHQELVVAHASRYRTSN